MNKDRRKFLKIAAAGAAAAIPATGKAFDGFNEAEYDTAFGVLVDTTLCIGCRNCEMACNREHKLTDKPDTAFTDKSVFAERRRPSIESFTVVNPSIDTMNSEKMTFGKTQCMHCNHPACVSACIVGALSKCPHGSVSYDAWKCIGCRYCMVACPFQIPTYEYKEPLKPRVMKCNFCYDRIHDNKRPACVESCPVEALTFGSRKELIKLAQSKISGEPNKYCDHIYGEHEIGGTSWLYLASKDFINYDLPKMETEKIPSTTESIQHGIFKSFLPPLALYGFLGLIMHSLRQENGHNGDNGHSEEEKTEGDND